MKVSKVLEQIAKSKPGQQFYRWCAEPGKDRFLNNTLPQVETVLSTCCYVWSTAKQKNIDKDRKQLLQIQNVGSGVVGLLLSSAANKWIGNQTENIIKDLDPNKLDAKTIRKVSTGLRVISPVLTTAICMRLLIPTVLACFSGKVMDKVREQREEKKNLNILA